MLTKDGDNIETLRVRQWADLKGYIKTAFLNANKIAVAQAHRKAGDLGKNVANEINCKGYKHQLKAAHAKKQNGKSKPDCITVDGTIYRTVNVILRQREQFMKIKESHDRNDTDSRNPKATDWGTLHSEYSSNDTSLLKLSPSATNALVGYSVEESVLATYDELTIEDFKRVVEFLQAGYQEAHNKKTLSGFHWDFGACVGGKVYLLYFHQCLSEAGDKPLMTCVYLTLDDELKGTSLDPFKPRSHLSPKNMASDRSMSQNPDISFRTKKLAAVETTEAAASAITTRGHECRVSDQFDEG